MLCWHGPLSGVVVHRDFAGLLGVFPSGEDGLQHHDLGGKVPAGVKRGPELRKDEQTISWATLGEMTSDDLLRSTLEGDDGQIRAPGVVADGEIERGSGLASRVRGEAQGERRGHRLRGSRRGARAAGRRGRWPLYQAT